MRKMISDHSKHARSRFARSVLWRLLCILCLPIVTLGVSNAQTPYYTWKVDGLWSGNARYAAGPTTTFNSKGAALAALQALDPISGQYLTVDAGLTGMDANSTTHKITYASQQPVISAWEYKLPGELTLYANEAAAIAAVVAQYSESVPECARPSVTLTPISEWGLDTGGLQAPETATRGARFYTLSHEVWVYPDPNGPAVCTGDLHSPTERSIDRLRTFTCPSGYGVVQPQFVDSPLPPGVQGPICLRDQYGLIKGKLLECPSDGASTQVGNPCDVATGDKTQTESDYSSSGSPALRFARTYHSATLSSRSAIGEGWTHNFSGYLVLAAGVPKGLVRPEGHHDALSLISDEYVSLSGAGIHVRQSGTDWIAYLGDGGSERYDSSGKLVERKDPGGSLVTLTYAANGNLTEVNDGFGRTLQLEYTNGRVARLIDPAGQFVDYAYGPTGNLIGVSYQDGTSKTYHYEDTNFPNHLTGITDEVSVRFATWTYNSSGNVVSSQHAGGAGQLSIVYGTNTSTVTDAAGTVSTYTFNVGAFDRRRLESISRNGLAEAYIRPFGDAQRRVSQITDPRGVVTKLNYDRDHLLWRKEAFGTPLQRDVFYQYGSVESQQPTRIDEPGRRTTFTYDANGNVLTRTVLDTSTSESRTWTNTYTALGQILTADGPRTDVSDVTTYTYYSCTTGYQCGQVHTITNALGHVTTYSAYDAHGRPLTIADPNGAEITFTYDERQRLTSRTISTEQTTFDYWPTGLLKKATLADGSFLKYTYDSAHRLTEIEDSEGNRVVYALDAMGNRVTEQLYDSSSALTQTRTRVFNTLNQLWKELGAAGTAAVTTTFSYDNNGNRTGINAPLSRNIVQAYDELNRLKQVTNPLAGATQYGYNALDQLISVTDPRSKVTSYTYNALGDLKQQVSPDTATTANTFDSAGNLSTTTDARSKTGTYAYDALNRVTTVTYPDQTISYTYDAGTDQLGRLTQVTDASGSTSWSYDTQGRVLSRQQMMGVNKTVGYAYDSTGRLQTLTLPSGNVLTYGYTDGKVTSLILNGSITILSDVLYQPFGPTRGWTWGNSTLAIREYDTDGKITDIDSAGLKTYNYDNAFRITGITDAANSSLSQSYGYDLLDRLTSATGTSLNQGWTYDASGNRLSQTGSAASTYTVDSASNRLSGVSGALTRTYSYDSSGNIASDGSTTFVYNDVGRMISTTKASVTTTYSLNALGQRVKKTSGASSTYFAFDEAGHLIGEYDGAGNLIQETIWLDDIPVATLRPNGSSGVDHFYVHTDHLDAPRRVSRPSDNVVLWRWDADPFGTTGANQDPDGDSSQFAYNLRFPGQYHDAETGLHYNYYRDGYDSAVGRYTQSDPIGLNGGINTYTYVENDPTHSIDDEGLQQRPRRRSRMGEYEAMAEQMWGPRLAPPARPRYLEPLMYYTTESAQSCGICLRVYFVARVEGLTRPEHRATALRQFSDYINGPAGPLNAQAMSAAMRAPGGGLRNPTGFVWHHPYNRRGEVWLVRQCDHVDPLYQPLLHPGGSGGMNRYFRPQ